MFDLPAAATDARKDMPTRFAPLYLAAGFYCAVSVLTRLILTAVALHNGQVPAASLIAILPMGALYDTVTGLYLLAPLALFLLGLPERVARSRAFSAIFQSIFFASVFGLFYLALAEYYFFEEFNARFNFIAYEYLVYPHEVFVNIWDSYPVGRALAAVLLLSAIVFLPLRFVIRAALRSPSPFRERIKPVAIYGALLVAAQLGVDMMTGRHSDNRVTKELTQNGIYSLFNAVSHGALDYPQYYPTIERGEAEQRVRALVAEPNASFIEGAANPLARRISNPGARRRLHVLVLLEESLGAEFVGAYGDPRELTPNLDRIAEQSLVFTNVYASGTRTVRGMEAVCASFPPLPPESIIKRAGNERLFNWATVMRAEGYTPTFIYGGYATFDNMKYFFGHNGYRVIDRSDMDAPKFSNIWGVSDEDLFRNAFRVFDEQHARGEWIFSIIMTTSNHKPFTFPSGIPGVKAEGGGRKAGVRYADYAIGRFFDELSTRRYADDTMVIIVGDHGARVYGREDFPLRSYELPLLVHAPKHFTPTRIDLLMSQIDLAPTLLGLLNISYNSVFFGRDVLAGGGESRLVPLNHNRDIALLSGGILTELEFRKASESFLYDKSSNRQVKIAPDPERSRDAAAVFQLAYEVFTSKRYAEDALAPGGASADAPQPSRSRRAAVAPAIPADNTEAQTRP